VRVATVEQNHKRLVYSLQLIYDAFFRFFVLCTGDVGDTPVCGDYQPYRRMFVDDLLRADFRRHIKRNLGIKPRGEYHSGRFVFDVADSTRNNITNTVNQADVHGRIVFKRDVNRLFRNKLRLGSHDCLARRRLGQLVNRTLPPKIAVDIRNNNVVHKLAYKCGFAGTYRTNYAYIDIPVSSLRNVLIN